MAPRVIRGTPLSDMWLVSYLALWTVVALEGVMIGVMIMALLRVFGGLHARIEECQEAQGVVQLKQGDSLVDADHASLAGDTIKLSRLWSRGTLLLLFISIDCVPCQQLLTAFRDAYRDEQLSGWDVCVLCVGAQVRIRQIFQDKEFPFEIPVAMIEHRTLRSQYHILETPTLAIVGEGGHVISVVPRVSGRYVEMLTRRSSLQNPVTS